MGIDAKVFLYDEHDIEYSNSIYEKYVGNIAEIEKQLVDMKLQSDVADKDKKKQLAIDIKNGEETVHAMKIAMKSLNKFKSSFEIGMATAE